MTKKVRVAILGGGMAGVGAAWALTHGGPADVDFEITVYDADWRLGGKCASGRNSAAGNRAEEHGIHILLGFYSQLLRILRDCYSEVDPALGFPPFSQALEPGDAMEIPDYVGGAWNFWTINFPPNDLAPGDADPNQRDFLGAIARAVELLLGWRKSYEALVPSAKKVSHGLEGAVASFAGRVAGTVKELLGLFDLRPVLRDILDGGPATSDLTLEARHLFMAIYFGATNLLGILEQRLFTPEAFQTPALNALDYKAWLKAIANPLPDNTDLTWDSPIVNAIYDLCFSRAVGFAAGAALYDTLLMLLLYSGHVFYRMAGTGDVVFAPLYFALRAKNVRFRFQHTITDVVLGPPTADGEVRVARVTLEGDGAERTVDEIFVKVDGHYCWPSQSLVNRPAHPITLGPDDFDYVISAIPIGALRASAPSLVKLPAIAKAVEGMTTIPTQSIQLWSDQTLADMGWSQGRMMLGSFARPFNSAADMAQVLPTESLPNEKAVMYMSDVYTGDVTDPNALARVETEAVQWIEASLPILTPGFSWDRLVDPAGGSGSQRFKAQYARANVTGTELYVASAPGTVVLRLPADGAGVANLLLASDWVLTEENQGCVEGACRSGVQAANALFASLATAAPSDDTSAAAAPPTLPTYIQHDNDWVFPPAVKLAGAEARAFPFLADRAKLAALCARYSLGNATIEPWLDAVPLVLVYGCACDDIRSTDPQYQDYGRLAEREFGVFVPVTVKGVGKSFAALLCPYMFVDNSSALIAGREIYGLPKELATFPEWPFGAPVPLPLTATSLALPERGDLATPRPIFTLSELVAVTSDGAAAKDAQGALSNLWPALLAGGPSIPLVALKQFRAIENESSACYQALIRCAIEPTVTAFSWELGVWELTLPPYFFPVPSDTLGVASGAVTFVSVKASLSFTLSLGEVIASP